MHCYTGNTEFVDSGTYGAINVTTRSTFAEEVRFRTTVVAGTLEAGTITGNRLILCNGTVLCSGDVHVEHITGRGRIKTDGNIVCNGIDLTGDLHSNGNITCNGNLLVTGFLGSRHIRAQDVCIHGVLKGDRINGDSLEVRPLRSTMFTKFNMSHYEDGSSASHIDADKVEARRLTCRTLKASTAVLRDNSMVENAHCSISIGLDRSSYVMLLNRECRKHHLATA